MEALRQLKAAEPSSFLSPSKELSQKARAASQYLFSALKPYSSSCELPELVTDGFDAEQIWAQIEAQREESVRLGKTQLRKLEKSPEELEKQFSFGGERVAREKEEVGGFEDGVIEESDGDDVEEEEEEEEEGSEEEEGEEEEGDGLRDVEDEFFKIKDLERFVEGEEEREFGNMGKGKGKKGEEKKRKRRAVEEDEDEDSEDEEEEEDEDEDEDDDEDDDELGIMGMDGLDDDDGGDDAMGLAKYDDFFGKKKIRQKKTWEPLDRSNDSDLDERPNKKKTSKPLEGSDDSNLDERPKKVSIVEKKNLSTHEKEQEKLRSQIEEMEKSNLQSKEWMMRGEVTAGARNKNSALEVDLDFEHNVRPAPVITEEVTATLEELIQKRILEGRFNDVRKPPTLLNKAPKEMKEMDENKSKKGLGEIYADDYVQNTGLVSAALSFSDEQKKEASTLFKKLCLKLDALSHFHFTPKPVIEDMSIQANVPALAMEEIAPMAVSDAAMLAPEEVFSGKGDIKEQTELTQAERKMRRANKKRKFKAESEKRMAGKAEKSMSKEAEGNEAS